jgi:hypothetical protein
LIGTYSRGNGVETPLFFFGPIFFCFGSVWGKGVYEDIRKMGTCLFIWQWFDVSHLLQKNMAWSFARSEHWLITRFDERLGLD